MLVSMYSSLGGCLFGICLGYLTAALVFRRRQETGSVSHLHSPISQHSSDSRKEMEALTIFLSDLTSQVDSQVGQHTHRIGEITNTLETPGNINHAFVLAASKSLITANQQLQTDLEQAKSEIAKQREKTDMSLRESRTDALTNLPNRRAFDQELYRAFADHRRAESSYFSLAMIDIDHFKQFNDRYGHMVGDQMLKHFARYLKDTFRESDFVARFGGEEFVAILPHTRVVDAVRIADQVRTAIAESRYGFGDFELRITASIGVKEVGIDESDTELLKRADDALYGAKKSGRNCVRYHDGTTVLEASPEAVLESLVTV